MGFVIKAVKSVTTLLFGIASKVVGGIFGFAMGGKSSKKTKYSPTLNKQLEPEAFRKIAFGRINMPLDLRYWEVHGAKGTLYDEVIAACCHRINAFKELYLESDLAINDAGVVQSKYVGVLTRDTRLGAPGQTALSVGSGSQWTSLATFDGCAHMALKWTPDEIKLPNGIPSRYTQVIEAALVYDPRRDSTVVGGSGPHRIADQTTWSYATLDSNSQPIGRNNALQALWYLIGWRVQNPVTGEMVLVAGRGIDPQDINLATFVTGANNCEVAGYYTDMVLSTEDNHTTNEEKITCNGLIGRLIDPGGLWSYYANVNDTANIAVELTDADILEGVSVNWNEYRGMSEQYNQVRGKFIYPASPVLFQTFPYPMVRDATYEANLGVKRSKPQDFEQVLDSTLAQRLARLLLNQGQYQGEFSAGFNYRMLKAQAYSIVSYTSERYGWVKLFRVWRQDISTDSGVSAMLREVHSSIWSAGSVASALSPSASNPYNPAQAINATGVAVALYPVIGANGDKGDGFRIFWDAPATNVRRTEVRYRLVGTVYWETAGPVARDVTQVIVAPLLSGAVYEVAIRHISIHEVPGPWINPTTAPANGSGQFQIGATGTINSAAITAAGGTALWSNIVGQTNAPTNNADRTLINIAAGFTGEGTGARANNLAGLNASEGTDFAAIRSYATAGDAVNRNGAWLVDTRFWSFFNSAGGNWTRTQGTLAGQPAFYFQGPNAAFPNYVTWPHGNAAFPAYSDGFPAKPGEIWTIETSVNNANVTAYLQFYDRAGTELAAAGNIKTLIPDAGTPFTPRSFTRTAPANTAFVYCQFYGTNNSRLGPVDIYRLRSDAFPASIAGSVIANPDFKEVSSDGRPARWRLSGYGTPIKSNLSYLDATRTAITALVQTDVVTSDAFKVEANTKYEMEILIASNGVAATTAYIEMHEYDSELPSSATYIRGASLGEDGLDVNRTRVVPLGAPSVPVISGGYTRYTYIYAPTGTAKWASIGISEFGPHRLAYQRVYIRDKATLGAVAGSNMFRADGVTGMSEAEIRTALGYSAGFIGEGTLARLNSAAWGTNISARPVELTDGRIVDALEANGDIRRSLPVGIGSRQSSTITRSLPRGARIVNLRDGEAYTFPVAWGSGQIPSVQAYNNGFVDSSNYLDIKALSITSSGFTADAKKVGPGTITQQSETTNGTASSPRIFEKVKQLATEAHDDNYTFNFNARVNNIATDEVGIYEAGSLAIGLWTNDGATWQLNSTIQIFGQGGGSINTTINNITGTIARDGMGANDLFGISIESGSGTILAFNSVNFATSSGNTISTATPTNFPGIPFLILGGTEN